MSRTEILLFDGYMFPGLIGRNKNRNVIVVTEWTTTAIDGTAAIAMATFACTEGNQKRCKQVTDPDSPRNAFMGKTITLLFIVRERNPFLSIVFMSVYSVPLGCLDYRKESPTH